MIINIINKWCCIYQLYYKFSVNEQFLLRIISQLQDLAREAHVLHREQHVGLGSVPDSFVSILDLEKQYHDAACKDQLERRNPIEENIPRPVIQEQLEQNSNRVRHRLLDIITLRHYRTNSYID
ncbi:Hypothetical_protein [Hexamita inflata]|uniref:Hypothetical_protein n=1 Tax=Hexamita inflata TaxID=28002 RepID=A0AA86RG47_9EUKA|nr:Hypothetical protein HINF_LOCUS65539 [Hexamita inflata]